MECQNLPFLHEVKGQIQYIFLFQNVSMRNHGHRGIGEGIPRLRGPGGNGDAGPRRQKYVGRHVRGCRVQGKMFRQTGDSRIVMNFRGNLVKNRQNHIVSILFSFVFSQKA